MPGRHEVALPTVRAHHRDHHPKALVSDWLVAEWGYVSAYNTRLIHGVVIIDTDSRNGYDDGDTPTELWCRAHMVEVGQGAYEVDYA